MEFYSKNKFERLVNLVGFVIRIYHDKRSAERQISTGCFKFLQGVNVDLLVTVAVHTHTE